MLDQYKKLLQKYVSFKSVSTGKEFKAECEKTAQWLKALCEENGFSVELVEGYGNPIILATYDTDPLLDTCLVYGHYDVQPADKADGWDSEPFEVVERDGRLYARGIMDNKGQLLIHLVTLFDLIEKKQLGFNIKLLIEGDEETGSPRLADFISDYAEKLKSDLVMLSDGETGERPTMEAGFRGGFNATLTLKTSHTDLHSGHYGGAVPSAAHELGKFIADLHDTDNRVTIKGFYDDVDQIEEVVLKANQDIPFDLEHHQKISGTKAVIKEPEYDYYSQVGLRPAILVTGIASGYAGEGYRNSIPSSAEVKLNFRLVKNQDSKKVVELFKQHLADTLPEYLDYEFNAHDPYEGVKLEFNSPHAQRTMSILEKQSGQKPLLLYCGGGLPIVTYLYETLGIPTLSIGLANEDSGMHAANENFRLDYIERGLAFSNEFFSKD